MRYPVMPPARHDREAFPFTKGFRQISGKSFAIMTPTAKAARQQSDNRDILAQ
jgi:hypothetical protein